MITTTRDTSTIMNTPRENLISARKVCKDTIEGRVLGSVVVNGLLSFNLLSTWPWRLSVDVRGKEFFVIQKR